MQETHKLCFSHPLQAKLVPCVRSLAYQLTITSETVIQEEETGETVAVVATKGVVALLGAVTIVTHALINICRKERHFFDSETCRDMAIVFELGEVRHILT